MTAPRKKQAPAPAATPRRAVVSPRAATVYDPRRRTTFVVEVLGNQAVASALRVNKSQPSRWKSGTEAPSDRVAAGLVDLDYVLARLLLVWDESVARDWLGTPNGFLDGATPLEVIEREGPLPVLEAIDAEASGAYA